MNSLAIANDFVNETAEEIFSQRLEFLADGLLRQNLLTNANAMAWCTQFWSTWISHGILGSTFQSTSRIFDFERNVLVNLIVNQECPSYRVRFCVRFFQRKTKGQQLKGKIVRHFFTFLALFSTFPHFFTLFRTFSSRTFS